MNINKALFRIKNRFTNLAPLRSSDYIYLSKSLSISVKYHNIPKKVFLGHHGKLIERTSSYFYSSAANREQIPVIAVPSLTSKDLSFDSLVSHEELCAALQKCETIEEQMVTLASTLGLSPKDVENRIYFMKEIESLLKPFFGELKIQIFGSSLNGFGFKGCDIDMSFETFANEKDKISYIDAPDVPLVSEVMSGKVSPAELSLLPDREQLLFIHAVLLEFYKESDPATTIFINAHIPLVRFYHDKYGLKCDLSCKNRVAFANTKLLYLFGKLDDRVIPLVMTLRYWAKHVEIIGKGLMFNTYTVSLLIIHFLQTRKPPILPSAEYILSLSDSLQISDMSDKSFLQIRERIPPSENKQTLSELLRDFFFYYLHFDFTRVICPLIGGSVPREEFFSNCSKKFRMNTVCVQDPLSLSHNVAELVDFKTCRKLFTEIQATCKLFQSGSYCSPSTDKWGISALLDKPDEYQSNNSHKWKNSLLFDVPYITKPLITDCLKDDQKQRTIESILFLLRHVLLFECKPLAVADVINMFKKHDSEVERCIKEIEFKFERNAQVYGYQSKTENFRKYFELEKYQNFLMLKDFQEFISKHTLLSIAECKVSKNSLVGRDHVSLENLSSDILNDLVEKERYISVNAAASQSKLSVERKEKVKPSLFFIECYESSTSSESHLLVNFRPFQKMNPYSSVMSSNSPIIGIFLKEYLPKLISDLNKSA